MARLVRDTWAYRIALAVGIGLGWLEGLESKIDYALAFTFVKVSILLLCRKVFAGNGLALATNIVMGYVVAWGIPVTLVSVFSCSPVNGFWDTDIPSNCVSAIMFFQWTSVTNVLGNISIFALPLHMIWKAADESAPEDRRIRYVSVWWIVSRLPRRLQKPANISTQLNLNHIHQTPIHDPNARR